MSTLAWVADSGHRDCFVKSLNAQRKGGEFCDVLLKISGRTLPTHACVLSACSSVFRELIYADRSNAPHLMTNNAPQEIELVMPSVEGGPAVRQGDGLEAMVDLLDYIYTGNIALKRETINMVVKLAEAFALEGLTSMIKTHVVSTTVGTMPAAGRKSSGLARKSARTCQNKSNRTKSANENSKTFETKSRPRRDKDEVGLSAPRVSFGTDESDKHRVTKKRSSVEVVVSADVVVAAGADAGVKRVWEQDCRIGCVRAGQPPHTYSCAACDFSTGDCTKMLTHHRQVEHSQMQCSLCSSIFVDRATFLAHLTRHEDRRRPFFCRLCSYQGKSRANLAAHVAKHAVERPYKCDECDRGFKWLSSLKIHKLSHLKTKNHLCDHCGYSTSYLNNLRVHERKHNGGMFPCTQCSYQADSRSLLKRHERTHAKLKPLVCEVCGQRFAQTGSLREHSKQHDLKSNLIYCQLCPYKTLRHYRLKSHVERTHGCRPLDATEGATVDQNVIPT